MFLLLPIISMQIFFPIITSGWEDIEQPSCKKMRDGSYPPYVCKGETSIGRCFCCSDQQAESRRIFGWSWLLSESDPKDDKMTCSCSRQREALKRTGVSIHCSENGNYDKLQCDNGLCWCVEPVTGKPTERVYPESMMRYLPCYLEKPSALRRYYLRQCESAALARELVLRKFQLHGTKSAHIDMPLCDYDGSYKAFRYDKEWIHCTEKSGKQIGTYAPKIAEKAVVTCNCARDSVLFQEENIEFTQACAENGNYEPSQYSNGMKYCVDNDGFSTTTLGDDNSEPSCAFTPTRSM
ncbi:uncharacterized protein [Venturia canescens]|uniref:uncharacterized protein n=1 Tax=Venturia canescens TaxID=32260 RepID=UPI001C9D5155|nr:uncharacterized protein LOC122415754 [Venturia canescens]